MNSKRRLKSKFIVLIFAFSFIAYPASAADLNDLYNQKDQLNKDLDKYQSAVQNKEQEAKTLSNQINNLEGDIKGTETKLSETGSQITQTNQSIESLQKNLDQKNEELKKLKRKLNTALVELYRFSSRSGWELLLANSSLGSNSNQLKYIQAVEVQVKTLNDRVAKAKDELEKQKKEKEDKKNELDQLRVRQEEYKKGVEYQKTQKDKLLGMTVQQKMTYEEQVQKLKTEITHISSAIYAERQKKLNKGKESLTGGGSGYPYSSIDEPDAWGFLTRECTSYAAWYFNVVGGKKFVNTRPGQGSAYNWPSLARDQGYSVSSTPRRGAIITWSAGSLTSSWGHVAIVEEVNSDGTIDLSEFNWIKYAYSYRKNVNPADYGSYSYIF